MLSVEHVVTNFTHRFRRGEQNLIVTEFPLMTEGAPHPSLGRFLF